MAKQKAFFLSPLEIYQKEHPELFEKKPKSKPKAEKVYNCETCGLASKCKHPKIKRYGKGEKGILLVGLCPGRNEDKEGLPFVGASGYFLKKQLSLVGIDMTRDCVRTNIVQCFPGLDSKGHDKTPTSTQILSCAANLQKDIEEVKPKLIIALGSHAIKAMIDTKGLSSFSVSGTHGFTFPIQKYNAWVGCAYHPSFFCRQKRTKELKNDDIIFTNDLADILGVLDVPLPKPLTREGNMLITDYKEAIEYIECIIKENKPSCHDFETNTYDCYMEGAQLFTVSLTNEVESAACIPLWFLENGKPVFPEEQLKEVVDTFRKYLRSNIPKVVQNYYMEELWGRNILNQSMNNFVHDTMVTAHVINCQRRTTGLGFQAYQLTGHDYKKMVDTRDLQKETLKEVSCYNNWDTRYTLLSYYDQKRKLAVDLEKKKFNDWVTSCLPCLANLKDRGAIIDNSVLDELENKYTKEIKNLYSNMKNYSKIQEFEKQEDSKGNKKVFNPDSTVHLEKLLYDLWKEPKKKLTSGGTRGSADKEALLDMLANTKNKEVKDFINNLLRYRKCTDIPKKVKEYNSLLDPNNKVHSSFNMNTATTYRSSSNGPNLQNVFNHDEELKVFRKCFIPRPGNLMLEADYGAQEVRGICMMSKDPVLTEQIIKSDVWNTEHPEGGPNPWDPHRRWAGKIYSKIIEEITSIERYNVKNGFIFPSFYGSIPSSIARYEAFRGISESHIINIQKEFWGEYKEVRTWQDNLVKYYNDYGCYLGPTGCKRPGPLSLFQLYNNLIQGMAFHLLLDALQKIDDEMSRRGMESYAFMEIHDSITFDCIPEERFELVELTNEIMLSKRFDWQGDVPLLVEWEASKDNWYNKSEKTFRELMKV